MLAAAGTEAVLPLPVSDLHARGVPAISNSYASLQSLPLSGLESQELLCGGGHACVGGGISYMRRPL